MPNLTLNYFPFAGKAEASRVMLHMSKQPFTDNRIPMDKWPEMKGKMPYGQVPVLEVDGKPLAQTGAIERYAAKLAGLYPADPWEAAKTDEVACFADEFLGFFVPTMRIQDPTEKANAQKEASQKFKESKLTKLNEMAEKAGGNFLAGPKLTYGDVAIFCMVSFLLSGMFAGATKDTLSEFPAVAAYHKKVASVPEIAAYYANTTDRDSFKP